MQGEPGTAQVLYFSWCRAAPPLLATLDATQCGLTSTRPSAFAETVSSPAGFSSPLQKRAERYAPLGWSRASSSVPPAACPLALWAKREEVWSQEREVARECRFLQMAFRP